MDDYINERIVSLKREILFLRDIKFNIDVYKRYFISNIECCKKVYADTNIIYYLNEDNHEILMFIDNYFKKMFFNLKLYVKNNKINNDIFVKSSFIKKLFKILIIENLSQHKQYSLYDLEFMD